MNQLLKYEDLEPIFQLTKEQLQRKVYSGFFVKGRDYTKIGRDIRFYPGAINQLITPKQIFESSNNNADVIPMPVSKVEKKPKGCLVNFN